VINTNTISERSSFHSVITIGAMKTLGSRIKYYRDLAGLSQAALAAACGWKSQSRVGNYEKDTREPSLRDLAAIAKALRISISDLTEYSPDAVAKGAPASTPAPLYIVPKQSRITDRPGFIEIPQLDVHGSMGSGAIRPDTVDVIQRMTVSMDFLRQSVTFSNATNLALITGIGDSMEGTFNDGDLLLVDRGVNEVKVDAVYVLSHDDELYIKRLQRRGDGTFSMISDNRRYDPIQITGKDLERFEVLGRVLLAWNARKL
jgi:phage repressor protein C with HTH and peptisase S24 domain